MKSYASYRMVSHSMTLRDPDPDFKVVLFFDVKYLENVARYSHSYY